MPHKLSPAPRAYKRTCHHSQLALCHCSLAHTTMCSCTRREIEQVRVWPGLEAARTHSSALVPGSGPKSPGLLSASYVAAPCAGLTSPVCALCLSWLDPTMYRQCRGPGCAAWPLSKRPGSSTSGPSVDDSAFPLLLSAHPVSLGLAAAGRLCNRTKCKEEPLRAATGESKSCRMRILLQLPGSALTCPAVSASYARVSGYKRCLPVSSVPSQGATSTSCPV